MVHVLSCHQFAGDTKTLTPSQDPLAIFASPTQLFVATLQHSINVYGLGKGLSNGYVSLQHSFTTAGLVKQGVYCPTGKCFLLKTYPIILQVTIFFIDI